MTAATSFLDFSLRSLMPAFFIFGVLVIIAVAKAVQLAYHRGRRDYRDEHFVTVIRPDDSGRERL